MNRDEIAKKLTGAASTLNAAIDAARSDIETQLLSLIGPNGELNIESAEGILVEDEDGVRVVKIRRILTEGSDVWLCEKGACKADGFFLSEVAACNLPTLIRDITNAIH